MELKLKKQKFYYEYIQISIDPLALSELNRFSERGWRVVLELIDKIYLLERCFEIED